MVPGSELCARQLVLAIPDKSSPGKGNTSIALHLKHSPGNFYLFPLLSPLSLWWWVGEDRPPAVASSSPRAPHKMQRKDGLRWLCRKYEESPETSILCDFPSFSLLSVNIHADCCETLSALLEQRRSLYGTLPEEYCLEDEHSHCNSCGDLQAWVQTRLEPAPRQRSKAKARGRWRPPR